MKKIYILILICFIPAVIFADVIPEDSHPVERRIIITNAGSFPDLVFVGYVKAFVGPVDPYIIENNILLINGYKFNTLYVLCFEKTKFESLGGLDGIDFENYIEQQSIPAFLSPYGGFVNDANPIIKEEIFYTVTRADDTVSIGFSMIIFHYNDGTPSSTIVY